MKNFFKLLLIIVLSVFFSSVKAQKKIKLASPNGEIVLLFSLTKNAPEYSVSYKGKTLVANSTLGLAFKDDQNFEGGLKMLNPEFKNTEEKYDLVVGKTKSVRDQVNELTIPLVEKEGRKRRINLCFKAFNDGLAFRYEFPSQRNWTSYTLVNENSTFNIVGNPTVKALFWGDTNNSHEGYYQTLPYNELKVDTLLDMPALFDFSGKAYMAITEANLRDYAGMYLTKANGVLRSYLSPLLGQQEIKVKAIVPHQTPWRVLMIADKMGTLIESNILTSLNDPTQFKDLSWIKPGKTTFKWWNGDITPDTTFTPGINFNTEKYYIDFCAQNNIEYHSVIGYGGYPWYKSNQTGYSVVDSGVDLTASVPTLDMQKVCDYAKSKGVGIHVWVHWKALYPQIDKAFDQFEKWGIKGMMVDFLNRDDQEMVNIQEEILQKAAEHHLFVQFHGAYKPTGLSRTYPNEFTREAALNYEINKAKAVAISPEHDLDVAFTRSLAGPTDYHLGGFRATNLEDFKPQRTKPLVVGTRAHMLAMYVILESYLNMVADYPQAYEGQQGFEFLKKIPTTWDETKVTNAQIDEYITIARRKGQDWFVGTINNSKARNIEVFFDFLPAGNYEAVIFADAEDIISDPNQLDIKNLTINPSAKIKIRLAAGGGNAIILRKVD